jgi:hypothetical protein
MTDRFGRQAIHFAKAKNHKEIEKLLFEFSQINSFNTIYDKCLNYFIATAISTNDFTITLCVTKDNSTLE